MGRSFAQLSSENDIHKPGIRELLRRILEQGPVLYNPEDDNRRFVYTAGICQGQVERVRFDRTKKPYEVLSIVNDVGGAERLSGDIVEMTSTVLVFPTPIHALYVCGGLSNKH